MPLKKNHLFHLLKKRMIILSILILFILPTYVSAGDLFKRYEIIYSPSITSNTMKIFGYECLNDACSDMDETKVKIYKIEAWENCINTSDEYDEESFEECVSQYELLKEQPIEITQNQKIVVRYIGAESQKKFATYYFAKDYIGYVNVFTVGSCEYKYCIDNAITQIKIEKLDKVEFQIENFQVENMHNESQPLRINVPIKVSSEICNTLRFNNLVGYYPSEDGEYVDYSIDGILHLNINQNNAEVYYAQKKISIEASACSSEITFSWTPSQTGNLEVVLNAETKDSKVMQNTNSTATAQVYVYDSSAACQTVLTNLYVTDASGDPNIRDDEQIKVSFSYNSQVYLSSSDIRPSNTMVTIEILDNNDQIVNTKTLELSSQNTLNLKNYEEILSALSSGKYKVRVTAKASDSLCSLLDLPNIPAVLSLDFNVYKSLYKVTFHVKDAVTSLPIEGAQIQIDNNNLITDEHGIASIDLPEGDYAYCVSKEGYESFSGNIYDLNQDTDIYVSLIPISLPPQSNPPTIDEFSANTTKGYAPLSVKFTYAVSDIDNDVLTCYFDFDGDGIYDKRIDNCVSGDIIYTYPDQGIYNAKLIVSDGSNTVEKAIRIEVLPPSIPTILLFDANPKSGYSPLKVTFKFNVSDSDGILNITLYYGDSSHTTWDISGSKTYFYNETSHTYNHKGTYNAILEVYNVLGNKATASIEITVKTKPSGGGGGGGSGRRSTRHHGGGYFVVSRLTSDDVYIKDVGFPSEVYLDEDYTLKVIIKNNRNKEIKNLKLKVNIDGVFEKIISGIQLKGEEEKNYTFSVNITKDKYIKGNTYKIEVTLLQNNYVIDKKERSFIVKERIPEVYNVNIKDVYNADEPITYSFCIRNYVSNVVRIYIDNIQKRIHTLTGKDETCVQGSIGNTFDIGNHTFTIENKNYRFNYTFRIEKIIKIVDVKAPDTLEKGKTYNIEVTIETQIPSKVHAFLYENGDLKDSVEAFISDRESIKMKYTPQSTGVKEIKIIAQNDDGNTAQYTFKVKVIETSLTGKLLKYVAPAAVILGIIVICALIFYFH